MDPFAQFAVACSDQAVKDAGLFENAEVDVDRIGVIWGAGIGGIKTFEDEIKGYVANDHTPKFNPFFIPKMIIDISAGWISMRHGFRGPNFSTVSASKRFLRPNIQQPKP